ncbi:glycosyltransferase family 2 protein [Motilibacter aurantiacus]|uniref:glycosyltransferase family 2 protein n=1 Tax=Motilibacter aurantiacus TaxID=2714955 RepID=UPI001409139E|nr:glycosyltransferase [Motilibacter aurantiacus]
MTGRPPVVSVLLPAYNAERFVGAAVQSVLGQSFTDFELIVIDDGSTDGTLAALRAFDDPRVRLLSRENRGLVPTLVEAAGLARGTYLARMDADDVSLPGRLRRQVDFLDAHPGVALVGTDYTVLDTATGRSYAPGFLAHPDDLKVAQVVGNQFAHGSVMVRADVYRAVGGYDPERLPAEDMDLWNRVSRVAGIANLPERLFVYRDNPAGITSTSTAVQRTTALELRDEAFAHLLAHRRDYRLAGYHPRSTGRSLRDYHERRAMVLRDLAHLHVHAGLRLRAVPLLLGAVALAPWVSKTYRCFAGLASRRLLRRWAYEHL